MDPEFRTSLLFCSITEMLHCLIRCLVTCGVWGRSLLRVIVGVNPGSLVMTSSLPSHPGTPEHPPERKENLSLTRKKDTTTVCCTVSAALYDTALHLTRGEVLYGTLYQVRTVAVIARRRGAQQQRLRWWPWWWWHCSPSSEQQNKRTKKRAEKREK